jgi:nitric oxide reductase NorD protein
MEEWVGRLWHRCLTRAVAGHYPQAAVHLRDIERSLGIFFRALGGDAGLRLASATADRHGSRRSWLARLAGSGERLALTRRDSDTLRLPASIDVFPDAGLNRDLYFWLAALSACHERLPADPRHDACQRNQAATVLSLRDWPGLASRYRRLVTAHLPQRIAPARLPPAEAQRELAIRQALTTPGSVQSWPQVPPGAPPAEPVLLWCQADASAAGSALSPGGADEQVNHKALGITRNAEGEAHRAERVNAPREKHGILLPFRAESLLTLAEFFKINRSTDDDANPNAADAAQDLEQLTLTRLEKGDRLVSRVRFDLDLPSAAEDDEPLGVGQPFPEWDYRKNCLRDDYACVQDMTPQRAHAAPLPQRLARTARRLRAQFAALQPGRRWLKAQPEGSELDLDAIVRAHTDRICGRQPEEQLHLSLEKRARDLACLLLADLSLSTDAWVCGTARVIDVIRDSLLLFGEALSATGDRFAFCGFSSVKRHHVRFHRLKDFDEAFDARIRGRVLAIRPGYYTRLGAAIRRATGMLLAEAASRRILLILSDGKPNDLDLYDSRYGIEDTRMAVIEARRQGLLPFCLTIDREGGSYLRRLFGPNGYVILHKPEDLPQHLPLLYAQLTR